ncbi:MAG TPA: right-handed parallel beta-helix repeat-containing protein, partial [Candidatus Eisenbacteria bacterium]|nr:right-handed parallel beta-helix repeat-containing protein [Candidatus Eisenbacteria bacterium]
ASNGMGDAPDIQSAIYAASDGDVIQVLPGFYNESIDFLGKAITVQGSGVGSTVLSALNESAPVVTFSRGEGRASVLEGFTLSGGQGVVVDGAAYGGGVYILDAEPTVRGNRIVHNFLNAGGASYGGGIYCGVTEGQVSRSPLIEANVIDENSAATAGGGISIGNHAAPVVVSNTISHNEAGLGGGVSFMGSAAQPSIRENRIEWNMAQTAGGGISGQGAEASEILGNTLVFNVAGQGNAHEGSAIHLDNASAVIQKNTLVKNRTNGLGGGSLVLSSCAEVLVEKNIFCYSQSGSGLVCLGSGTTIRNNLVWGNAESETGDCANWPEQNGNIVADPELCGMDQGDYRPASDSPVLGHPEGPLGAYENPGCGPVAVQEITWGGLKARYDSVSLKARN